jgi:hypothetical protein
MKDDAETRGHEFPAYGADPLAETLRAVDGIKEGKVFAKDFADLQRDMVYGEKVEFGTAMKSVEALAALLGSKKG